MNGNDPDAAQGLYGGSDDIDAAMEAHRQAMDSMHQQMFLDEAEKLGLDHRPNLVLTRRLLEAEAYIAAISRRVEELEQMALARCKLAKQYADAFEVVTEASQPPADMGECEFAGCVEPAATVRARLGIALCAEHTEDLQRAREAHAERSAS